MYLQRLELQGFKSFAKRTILEFPELSKGHKGITSIVGPNGSGKSNIADSIRWVLGEQSLKTLRSKKSEDIIFSGSEKKGRLSMAEVSLFLNNEDKKVPVDYSEIVITRRLFRDGTSEYLLNKNNVRLQDVILLLAKAHFGQKSYSVVGQGMIDAILNASVGDRKDFFYEATGVKQYQIKKDQSKNKLARTHENLSQVEITLKELEPHLKSLTRQVKRLEQREEIERELREAQKEYYSGKWGYIQKKYLHFQSREKEKETGRLSRERELEVLQNDLGDLERGDSRTEIFDAIQVKYQQTLSEKNELFRELANIKGKLDVEYQKIGKMNVVWIGKRIDDIDARVAELQSQRDFHTEQLRSNSEILNQKQTIRTDIENQVRSLETKIHEIHTMLKEYAEFSQEELNNEIEVLYHAQKNLLYSIERLEAGDDLGAIKKEVREIIKRLETLYEKVKKSSRDSHSKEVVKWQEELNGFLQEKNNIFGEIAQLQSQDKMLDEKLHLMDREVEKLEKEKGSLQVEMNAASSENKKGKEEMVAEFKKQKTDVEKKLQELEATLVDIKEKLSAFNVAEDKMRCQLYALHKTAYA